MAFSFSFFPFLLGLGVLISLHFLLLAFVLIIVNMCWEI
uniref:Uncharacterized protein n=1 Tax=Arundo donax TaxID=35708 RepID=A0A0A8ZL75_ARUDO